jgi:hypothetical protein
MCRERESDRGRYRARRGEKRRGEERRKGRA